MVKQSIKASVRKRHSDMKAAQKLEADEREKHEFFEFRKRGRSLLRQLRALKEIEDTLNAELSTWSDTKWNRFSGVPDEWEEELEAILEIEDEEQA